MKQLALFDFDGTITTKDSWLAFIRYTVGSRAFWLGWLLISPALLLYVFKIIPNDQMKQLVVQYFWRGKRKSWLEERGQAFATSELSKILKKEALAKIEDYQQKGWDVFIVTASMSFWIDPWAKKNNISLICTELAVNDGIISGEIAGKNCYGEEKVKRIKQQLDLDAVQEIHVYGDSKGDQQMLELGDKAYYKYFKR